MKIICAGFPKTGTTSMAVALRKLGYDKVYDFEEAIEYGFDEWEEILLNKSTDINKIFDEVYSDVDVVVDFPAALFFEPFHRRWPEAKVILMDRNVDSQFTSYKNMIIEGRSTYWWTTYVFPYFLKSARRWRAWVDNLLYTGVGCYIPNELKWKQAYKKHYAYVKSVIPQDQLLIWNVSEGWEPLCKFLDKPVPTEDFPHKNKAGISRKFNMLKAGSIASSLKNWRSPISTRINCSINFSWYSGMDYLPNYTLLQHVENGILARE